MPRAKGSPRWHGDRAILRDFCLKDNSGITLWRRSFYPFLNGTTFVTSTTDPLGKITKSYAGPIAGGDHSTRRVSAAGRITEIIHSGLTTSQISGLVTPTSGLTPDPSTTVQTRNADGDTTLITVDPTGLNLRTAFTYDALGRQLTTTTGVGTPSARTTATAYNKRGLPTALTGADGRITTRRL